MNTITVTDKTTLGELLTILDLAEKSGKTPTPRELFETAGDPIAETIRQVALLLGILIGISTVQYNKAVNADLAQIKKEISEE